jgi:hypothetical protein
MVASVRGHIVLPNFAITGVAGFVAPRHLKAIIDTGNHIVAAMDPHDAAGNLDRFLFEVRFFSEIDAGGRLPRLWPSLPARRRRGLVDVRE